MTQFGWLLGVEYVLLVCIVMGAATAVLQWFLAEPRRVAVEYQPAGEFLSAQHCVDWQGRSGLTGSFCENVQRNL